MRLDTFGRDTVLPRYFSTARPCAFARYHHTPPPLRGWWHVDKVVAAGLRLRSCWWLWFTSSGACASSSVRCGVQSC